MATPTGPERRFLAVGARKGADWGDALALGAGYGLPTRALAGFNVSRDYISANEADTPLPRTSNLDVIKPVDLTHSVDMLYDPGALGTLIALLMGTAGAPSLVETGVHKHTFQLADSAWGKFATIAAEFPGKIWECPSAKPMEWLLKASDRGFVTSELKLRGNTIIDDSIVNTATQMDALTYADRENRVLFRQNTVKMNAQAGGDVSAENALNVNGIEASIKRTGHDEPRGANGISILEPAEAGWPDIRLKLNFPRFDTVSAAFFGSAEDEVYQKAIVMFEGVLAGAAAKYSLKLYLPRLRMLMPEGGWDEIVKVGVELVAEEASAAPTGMSYTRPYIELVNKQSTDYLA